MNVQSNIQNLRKDIPPGVKLVCVSKFHPTESIMEAYNAGERIFGESRVQELIAKQPQLPDDIQWHFIGHLQTNKIKFIAPFVSLIHGVDSLKVLRTINTQAKKVDRTVSCLLQVHIADEKTKFGFSEEDLFELLSSDAFKQLTHVSVKGLMGMATFTDDMNQVRNEFKFLKNLFDKVKSEFFLDDENFSELSMGMSQDYQIAIEEGSTMIRIGTSIFGERDY
ncbi:MAG: YggS family pyridoxal phosphate-dependent enzyme [Bacteroidales bacterium]|nr:YggS family pyridoxal phosphate-dependent enzyme [Bacteroidales bacterium]